jgi:hypothetical protein
MSSIVPAILIGAYLLSRFKPGQFTGDVVYVTSEIDGHSYLVQNKVDKVESANMLALLNQRLTKLVDSLRERKNDFPENKKAIDLLISRFNGKNITEGNLSYDYTTYTLNKGQEINFCLRTRDEKDRLHDINLLTFVAIHELAHIASVQNDPKHITKEFNTNFKFLLKRGIDIGIYNYIDYSASPVNYCGTIVNASPI